MSTFTQKIIYLTHIIIIVDVVLFLIVLISLNELYGQPIIKKIFRAVKYLIRVMYFFLVCVPVACMLWSAIELSSINIINREVAQR